MKKIVRLTETDLSRIVKRVMNEQPLGGLLNMPETDDGGPLAYKSTPGSCKTYYTKNELSLHLFSKLRSLPGQPSQTDKTIQSWVVRLHNSISKVGDSNDIKKVLSEIKTQQQMGSVLNAYNKKFGKTLHQDLSGKYTITWDTIWSLVKKFTTNIKMGWCKERYEMTGLTA
jgi:hypothetical protein